MNDRHTQGSFDPVPQDEIDWLVEGELTIAERDALVARFDRQPEYWRRCALAFMERDGLRRSLTAIRQNSMALSPSASELPKQLETDANVDPPTALRPAATVAQGLPLGFLAIAAAILLAIGIGLGAWLQPESSGDGNLIADRSPQDERNATSLAAQQNADVWLQVSNVVKQLNVPDSEVIAVVSVSGDRSGREFLPVIESESLQRQVLDLPKPEVPSGYLEQAERAGWKFDVSRQFLSLNIPGGGSQLLPLDTLQYRFVGVETF